MTERNREQEQQLGVLRHGLKMSRGEHMKAKMALFVTQKENKELENKNNNNKETKKEQSQRKSNKNAKALKLHSVIL